MSVTLLDGGMGQELIARSAKPPHPLWSAQVMMDEPQIVQAVHADYIRAGAEVITLNSYTITPERLARDGEEGWFKPLQAKAIDLAKAAIDECGRPVLIGGCLPPLFASYRPDLSPDFDKSRDTYREIVAEQADHVDLIQIETMSSIDAATAACAAATETGLPVWVGLSVSDDGSNTLRSGEPLQDALDALSGMGAAAILLNCSIPEAISKAIPHVAASGIVCGGYANGFTSIAALEPGGTVDSLEARSDLGPTAYADHVDNWIDAGATIVGGCCEVGPAHITEIARRLGKLR